MIEMVGRRKRRSKVRREDFGDGWPLTVDRGTLIVAGDGAITFKAPNGVTYAVNGLAARDHPSIEPIWITVVVARVELGDGEVIAVPIRKDISPLIRYAQSL